jgi:hypothetical protein
MRPAPDWDGPTGSRTPVASKAQGGERTPHMRFRRRYNTAALVTVALVAVVLSVLAAVPMVSRGGAPANRATPALGAVANRFQVVTYEAESPRNTLIGSAAAAPYDGASGGQLVRGLGNWNNAKGPGALRLNQIVVPSAGPYVVTFYFVNIKGGAATRTVVVTASGSASSSVTVTSDPTCCTSQAVVVFLFKGDNSITFANPMGEAPAIDRITVKTPVS